MYPKSPAEVWRVLSDANRTNEAIDGMQAYTAEDMAGPDGVVRRHAQGRLGPLKVSWQENFGEWIENSYIRQMRYYDKGPMRVLGVEIHIAEEAGGTRVVYEFKVGWNSSLVSLLHIFGLLDKLPRQVART